MFKLIQFEEKGKIFTYMPDFPAMWYQGMNISAVFNVRLKDNRTWFQKTFLQWKWNKYWNKHLIGSQVNKTL